MTPTKKENGKTLACTQLLKKERGEIDFKKEREDGDPETWKGKNLNAPVISSSRRERSVIPN